MKAFRSTLLALVGFLAGSGPCHAQAPSFVWAEWETSNTQKHGPEQAKGLFVYFHAKSPEALSLPIPSLFSEMARIAQWDILRINRIPFVDEESRDDSILRVVADEVARARQDGYRRIIVGGISRGGWLALLSATVPGVDAVIGLAPGTTTLQRRELERTRDALAQKLTGAKARRIAAFFFDGDPREETEERRAVVIRRALQSTPSTFMVVDRPPDLYGHAGAGKGRLARRYRDCLLQFVQGADDPPGEVECSRTTGYAIGAEIGFPSSVGPVDLPPEASPALAAHWGRWEGDDELGRYMILDADYALGRVIRFRIGYSVPPGAPPASRLTDAYFELDEAKGVLRDMFPFDASLVAILRPVSATQFDFEYIFSTGRGDAVFQSLPLHKRQKAGR